MKKKLKLDLNQLTVQSFTTYLNGDAHKGGAVHVTKLTREQGCVSPLCMTESDPCACQIDYGI